MNYKLKENGDKVREQICQFIIDYTSEHSYAPTIREISKGVGLKSLSSVHSHLIKLECEGRIEIKPHCTRAIRVIRYKKVEN